MFVIIDAPELLLMLEEDIIELELRPTDGPVLLLRLVDVPEPDEGDPVLLPLLEAAEEEEEEELEEEIVLLRNSEFGNGSGSPELTTITVNKETIAATAKRVKNTAHACF